MRVAVKGRGVDVSDEVREKVQKRFEKIGKQVSELAQIDIELSEEKNPSIRESCRAEATLFLKGERESEETPLHWASRGCLFSDTQCVVEPSERRCKDSIGRSRAWMPPSTVAQSAGEGRVPRITLLRPCRHTCSTTRERPCADRRLHCWDCRKPSSCA